MNWLIAALDAIKDFLAPPASINTQYPGLETEATIFGRTYADKEDKEDNGIGAFKDPRTGRNYNTRDPKLVGVSIPIPIFRKTCRADYRAVSKGLYKVRIQRLSDGRMFPHLPIVDLGPGKRGKLLQSREGKKRLLDRTYGTCVLTNSFDNEDVRFWITDAHDNAMEIKGLEVGYVTI